MTFDFEHDQLITLSELVKKLPRTGNRPVHLATAHRWRTVGLAGGIKLEAIRVGGTWCTSWAAFRRFCDQVTAAKSKSVQPPTGTQKSDVEANKKLAADRW